MTTGWTTLVDASSLARALGDDDLAIVDARFALGESDAGEIAYRAGHVPGAVYAHLDHDLSDHARLGTRGAGRHPRPQAQAFTRTLGRLGITPRHRVAIYDAADGAYAARLWFLLRALGHRHAAVLDGGWARWTALGLPVETSVADPVPREYASAFDPALLADADAMQRLLDTGGLLVDARAAGRFRGEVEPIDPRAGHVPGAVNRPYTDNLVDGGFKAPGTLAAEFGALLDGRAAERAIVMCGSGVTACHHLLAMAHAGLPGARLSTGSWSGWISDPSRPVAAGG